MAKSSSETVQVTELFATQTAHLNVPGAGTAVTQIPQASQVILVGLSVWDPAFNGNLTIEYSDERGVFLFDGYVGNAGIGCVPIELRPGASLLLSATETMNVLIYYRVTFSAG
jgi:hypothetical protein